MPRNRSTCRRNDPDAAAPAVAVLIALDGHLDWRKLEEPYERDEDAACAFAPCASPPPRGLTERERQ